MGNKFNIWNNQSALSYKCSVIDARTHYIRKIFLSQNFEFLFFFVSANEYYLINLPCVPGTIRESGTHIRTRSYNLAVLVSFLDRITCPNVVEDLIMLHSSRDDTHLQYLSLDNNQWVLNTWRYMFFTVSYDIQEMELYWIDNSPVEVDWDEITLPQFTLQTIEDQPCLEVFKTGKATSE